MGAVPMIAQAYWPSLLQYLEQNKIRKSVWYFAWTTSQHFILLTLGNLFFWVLYHFEIPFFEKYKAIDEPWPWVTDPKGWRTLVWKSIGLMIFNGAVCIPFAQYKNLFEDEEHPWSMDVDKIPTAQTFALTLIFCMMCEDFFFSMSLRALHTPFLYKHIHKVHHSHIVTIGIASQYAHPLEYFFGNLLPTVAGPLILGSNMSMVSVLGWYALRVIETTEGHSGYDFPWSPFFILPFQPVSGYHAFHHSKNVGNYSSFFSIWDTVFNSNKEFYDYMDEQKELKIK